MRDLALPERKKRGFFPPCCFPSWPCLAVFTGGEFDVTAWLIMCPTDSPASPRDTAPEQVFFQWFNSPKWFTPWPYACRHLQGRRLQSFVVRTSSKCFQARRQVGKTQGTMFKRVRNGGGSALQAQRVWNWEVQAVSWSLVPRLLNAFETFIRNRGSTVK